MNGPVWVYEGERSYLGSFTGRKYTDGGYQIYYKNSCGDSCWVNSNDVKHEVCKR